MVYFSLSDWTRKRQTKVTQQRELELNRIFLERWAYENFSTFEDEQYFLAKAYAKPFIPLLIVKQARLSNEKKIRQIITKLKEIRGRLDIITGARGCLPKGTLIKTSNGLEKIEKIKNVLSYNFKTKKIEPKSAKVFDSGLKKAVKIHTPKGIICCSLDHKWYTNHGLKCAKDLNIRDKIILCPTKKSRLTVKNVKRNL